MIHQLALAVYYDWDNRNVYRFLEWRLTHDRWRVHLGAFWNPEDTAIFPVGEQAGSLAGKGLQVTLVLNH